ncbi:MAG: hypothetical protein WKF91_07925 [Segetibacter sp.]
MNAMEGFVELDKLIFYHINNKYSLEWLNPIMTLLKEAKFWIPLYLFLLIFFIRKKKNFCLIIIALSILTFAITDFTSAGILKPLIGRGAYNLAMTQN